MPGVIWKGPSGRSVTLGTRVSGVPAVRPVSVLTRPAELRRPAVHADDLVAV